LRSARSDASSLDSRGCDSGLHCFDTGNVWAVPERHSIYIGVYVYNDAVMDCREFRTIIQRDDKTFTDLYLAVLQNFDAGFGCLSWHDSFLTLPCKLQRQ
jgi:hypothetical protein